MENVGKQRKVSRVILWMHMNWERKRLEIYG